MSRLRSNPPEPVLFALAQQTPAPAPAPAPVTPVTAQAAEPETAVPTGAPSLNDIAAMAMGWSDDDEYDHREHPRATPAPRVSLVPVGLAIAALTIAHRAQPATAIG